MTIFVNVGPSTSTTKPTTTQSTTTSTTVMTASHIPGNICDFNHCFRKPMILGFNTVRYKLACTVAEIC